MEQKSLEGPRKPTKMRTSWEIHLKNTYEQWTFQGKIMGTASRYINDGDHDYEWDCSGMQYH